MNESESRVESLRQRAAKGDKEALGQLLEVLRPYLKMIVRRHSDSWLTRKEDDSDLVQQSIAEAIRDFPAFEGEHLPALLAWLQQIIRRNVDDRFRHHRRKKRDVCREHTGEDEIDISAGSAFSPSRRLLRDENAVLLALAMESLTDAQHEAIRLRHLESLSLSEVADRMDRSYDAVAQLIREGLKKLEKRLPEIAEDHFDT